MSNFTFEGFEPANTTPVPDVLFDELLSELSGAELKVMLYVIRRTLGFKKTTDAISLSQFEKGITTQEGKILDKGCGLNRETICKALKSLEVRGCIKCQKRNARHNDKDTTLYSIRFRGEEKVVGKSDQLPSRKSELPLVGKSVHGSRKTSTEVVGKSDPQETVLQQTDKQETVREDTYSDTASADRTPSLSTSTDTHSQGDIDASDNGQQHSARDRDSNHRSLSSAHSDLPQGLTPSQAQIHVEVSGTAENDPTEGETSEYTTPTSLKPSASPQGAKNTTVGDLSIPTQQNGELTGVDKQASILIAPVEATNKPARPTKPAKEIPSGPPPLPPVEMEWCTRKCLLKFDFKRGAPLIVKYQMQQASAIAKGMAENYSEFDVDRVTTAMDADPFYAGRGGVDIFDVGRNIAKYLKMLNQQEAAKHIVKTGTDMEEAKARAETKNKEQLAKLRERQAKMQARKGA